MKNNIDRKLVEQLKLQKDVEVPWHVWRFFSDDCKVIFIGGDQASFGGDFGDINDLRKAIEFYVDQLGGKVNWK